MYNCMFVSALLDPSCNSEKSANGGNKQILLLLLLLSLFLYKLSSRLFTRVKNSTKPKSISDPARIKRRKNVSVIYVSYYENSFSNNQ